MDIHKELHVSASTKDKTKVYILSIDGYVRTIVQPKWLRQPWSASFNKTYTICKLEEKVGGKLELRYGKSADCWREGKIHTENPAIKFPTVTDHAVVHTDSNVLAQVYLHNPDVFIMKHPPAECKKKIEAVSSKSPKFFLQVFPSYFFTASCCRKFGHRQSSFKHGTLNKFVLQVKDPLDDNGGFAVFRYDPVLSLIENTLTHPAKSLSGTCIPPAFKEGVQVTLEPTVLRKWYTQSKKHLHVMKGLRLEDAYHVSPCANKERSRWRRTTGACVGGPTKLDKATLNTLSRALKKKGEVDKNPYMRDIVASDAGSVCSTASSTIRAKVEVDGNCFEHVHPDLLSVFDMSYWVHQHPGNKQAEAGNGRNPISAFAEKGETDFLYPSHHKMNIWSDQRTGQTPIPMVGRLGDTLDFASLETELQTEEMATALGANVGTPTNGVGVCGSPGEVANIPSKGHHFYFLTNDFINLHGYNEYMVQAEINFPYNLERGVFQTVWYNVVLNAPDQLRHRMAWALSQITVVARAGVANTRFEYEPWLAYFDIHVRNAFGNYRDILKEVVFNPFMAIYLTYHGNRAFAYAGNYPDENFAREIMQLFTVGLWKLNMDGTQMLDRKGEPIPTYSNDDILSFAKVVIGLGYLGRNTGWFKLTCTRFIVA